MRNMAAAMVEEAEVFTAAVEEATTAAVGAFTEEAASTEEDTEAGATVVAGITAVVHTEGIVAAVTAAVASTEGAGLTAGCAAECVGIRFQGAALEHRGVGLRTVAALALATCRPAGIRLEGPLTAGVWPGDPALALVPGLAGA